LYPQKYVGKIKKQKEARTILAQPNSGFNHGIPQPGQVTMNIEENGQSEKATAEPSMFQKSIDGTIYTVYVHFSQTSAETLADKIFRLLESEAIDIA